MTIRFLTSWNGYQQGDVATLTNEATLISAGIARLSSEVDGPNYGTGKMAEFATDASGNAVKGIAPSGSIATDGTVTLGTALPAVFSGGIYLYFPSGAATGYEAGFLYCEMSSTTVGVAFTQKNGQIISGAGAYTGVTSEVTLATFTLALQQSKSALLRFSASHNNSAGTKTSRVRCAATQVYTVSGTTAVGQVGAVVGDGITSAQQVWSQAAASGITSLITYTSEDMNSAKDIALTAQLATATDYYILVHKSLMVM